MMHAFLTEISQMYQGCESGDVVFRAQFTLCKIEVRRLNCALPDQWLHRIPVQEIMVFFYTSDVNRKLAI